MMGKTLLPPRADPYARALVRLQGDHIARALVPAFYRFLQAQEPAAQIAAAQGFTRALEQLVALLERGEREIVAATRGPGSGLWRKDGELNWTDVMAGPCEFCVIPFVFPRLTCGTEKGLFRASNVLKHYRAFELPPDSKIHAWLNRLVSHSAFRATCSTEKLYLDSYER
jgi:hypothetical protein